jgi:hypothetical protein
MPQVPLYDTKVQGQNLPSIRVNTQAPIEAFGGGAGFQAMTNEATKLAVKAKTDADQISLMESESKMLEFENNFFYGENGASKKLGKDAFGLNKSLDEQYKSKYDEIYNSLPNQDVKNEFTKRSFSHKKSMDSSVMRHISNEISKYDDQTTNDFIANARGTAIQNYQSPDRMNMSLDSIKQKSFEYAQRKGYSPESTKYLVEQNVGKTHVGIIERMIKNDDDLAAEAYYKNVKDQIPGEFQSSIEGVIENGSLKGFSQRYVDNIMRKGYDEGSAYKLAASIDDPKKREAVEARIARQFNLKKQGEQDYQDNILEQAQKRFDETGDIDPIAIAKMDDKTKFAYKRYRETKPAMDDQDHYYKLYTIATDPLTRQKFMDHNLLHEKRSLTTEHFEQLMSLQKSLKAGSSSSTNKLNGAYSDAQVLTNLYISAGLNPKKQEEFSRYKTKVDDEIERYKQKTGKQNITNDELKSLARPLLQEVITDKGWFWDTKARNFNLEVESIPLKDLDLIKKALVKQNKPLTDKNIMDLYILKQGNK